MDERIDLSMSDPDLVPLLIQENYINCVPSSVGKDDHGLKRLSNIARAAESIADGDIINVQIRRYRQSQSSCLSSCIIPSTLRLDYLTLLLKQLTDPLRVLPKDEAVEKVVEFMDSYSISQEDFDTMVELSKFKGPPNPMDTLPGMKKVLKKRVAAILEPVGQSLAEDNGDALEENEDDSSDAEDLEDNAENKLQADVQSLKSKGIEVEVDLKGCGSSSGGKAPSARGRGRGKGSSEAAGRKGGGGRGSSGAAASKRKR